MQNGWVKIHRKIYDSELWLTKPLTWKIIWIYILGNVNHETKAGFERGEGFFNFTIERDLIDKTITIDMVKSFLRYARESGMLATKKTTRGIRIKVLKYNVYQDEGNRQTTSQTTREPPQNHHRTTTINKNVRREEGKKDTSEDKSSHGVSPPFIFGEYIKKLEDSERRDMNIIALYLDEKKPKILSADQMRVAVKRHLRPAKDLVPFTNDQILSAIPQARKATPSWTLETLVKILTK